MIQKSWDVLFNNKAGFWTAVFTGLLTIFTFMLYKVSDSTNETSRATQRSYISFAGISGGAKIVSDDRKTWVNQQLSINWINSGSTPARKAITAASYEPWSHELPKGFDFADRGTLDRTTITLGPKESSGVAMIVPVKDLADQRTGKSKLYFWGWIVYNDVFTEDPDRLTEFCTEMTQVALVHPDKDITDPANDLTWSQVKCREHNCYDADCSDYAERVKEARQPPKE